MRVADAGAWVGRDWPGLQPTPLPLPPGVTKQGLMPPASLARVAALCSQVFAAAVAFATNLFWGGNAVVQDALVKYLETDKRHAFIHTFAGKLRFSLASFRDWKSEVAFVKATVPGLAGQVHQVRVADVRCPRCGHTVGGPGLDN